MKFYDCISRCTYSPCISDLWMRKWRDNRKNHTLHVCECVQNVYFVYVCAKHLYADNSTPSDIKSHLECRHFPFFHEQIFHFTFFFISYDYIRLALLLPYIYYYYLLFFSLSRFNRVVRVCIENVRMRACVCGSICVFQRVANRLSLSSVWLTLVIR